MAPAAARAAKNITSAIDFKDVPPFWKRKNGILLYFLLTSSFLSSFASGFDGSMTNAMQLLPVWQDRFGHPTGSKLGLFGASTGIGGVIPLLVLNWMGDYWGRRVPTAIGAIIVAVAAIIETLATSLDMYIGGKILLGFGCSIVQMGAPVLIAELSHPKERAKVSSFYNTSVLLGYVIGAWITFGCIKMSGPWQWKLPTLLQAAPSVYQLALIFFSPESPRWLMAHGKEDKARQILQKYHGNGDSHSPLVNIEFQEIKAAIALEAELNTTWRAFFSSRSNWKRIFICTVVPVFSQSCGNLLISNFLPQILKDTGITSTFDSTLINGMNTLWSYLIAIAVSIFFDRIRRRSFFLVGSGGGLIVFIAWTIASQQYVEKGNLAAGRVVIACIFLFQGFYTWAWLNMVVAYPIELVTYQMRAKAWSYVLLIIFVAQIFGNYVNPIALESIGWHWYTYYCVWNVVIFLTVYFMFPETSGLSLEESSLLLDGASDAVVRKTSIATGENELGWKDEAKVEEIVEHHEKTGQQ